MSKFNFNIDDIQDDVQDDANNYKLEPLSKHIITSKSQSEALEDDLFIDLGLSSGTIWSKYNLGVNPYELNRPENWIGDYYAWGELETKDEYTWESYILSSHDFLTKYCSDKSQGSNLFEDELVELELIDDVAYNKNKLKYSKCRIPSSQQYHELLRETNNEYVNNYNGIKYLNGALLKSKNNGNTIFFPAAGLYTPTSSFTQYPEDGYYWTRSLYENYPKYAYDFSFTPKNSGVSFDARCLGELIRYVKM